MPTKFALDLQLLGGVWILQTFPALVFGLFWKWLRAPALLAGWVVGIAFGTYTAYADGIKPVHSLLIGGDKYTIYTGLLAITLNFVVACVVQALLRTPAPALAAPRKA
jgi:SSS family solute:Na+ symporter